MAVAKGAKYGLQVLETLFLKVLRMQITSYTLRRRGGPKTFNHYLYTRTLNPNGNGKLVVNSINKAYLQAFAAADGTNGLTGLDGFVVYYRGANGAVLSDVNKGFNMYATLPLSPPKQN